MLASLRTLSKASQCGTFALLWPSPLPEVELMVLFRQYFTKPRSNLESQTNGTPAFSTVVGSHAYSPLLSVFRCRSSRCNYICAQLGCGHAVCSSGEILSKYPWCFARKYETGMRPDCTSSQAAGAIRSFALVRQGPSSIAARCPRQRGHAKEAAPHHPTA